MSQRLRGPKLFCSTTCSFTNVTIVQTLRACMENDLTDKQFVSISLSFVKIGTIKRICMRKNCFPSWTIGMVLGEGVIWQEATNHNSRIFQGSREGKAFSWCASVYCMWVTRKLLFRACESYQHASDQQTWQSLHQDSKEKKIKFNLYHWVKLLSRLLSPNRFRYFW